MISRATELVPSAEVHVSSDSLPQAGLDQKQWPAWALPLVLTNFGLAFLLAFGTYWFGSIGSAIAYVRGDRLLPNVYTRSFGVAPSGRELSTEFKLTNWAGSPIRILGARSSCTCVLAAGLPATVQPRKTYVLKLRIRNRRKKGHVSEHVHLLLDDPQGKSLVLKVEGVFG
jgi:hypothetical protein